MKFPDKTLKFQTSSGYGKDVVIHQSCHCSVCIVKREVCTNRVLGAGEIAQLLKASTTLAED